MTRTAIIAAMPAELKPLTHGWQHSRQNGVDLWHWSFDDGEWTAACAGAGLAAATRAFAEAEKSGPLDQVISTGWAGALREELIPGQALDVSCVIDARTGERFLTSCMASGIGVLKGHGFSRAAVVVKEPGALAPEGCSPSKSPEIPGVSAISYAAGGMQAEKEIIPQGLKPIASKLSSWGTAEAVPFQSASWLVTSPKVADAHEKLRLAETYSASLVDMEASAIARLARMRGIPFHCIKGISDGYSDHLPDFNRFISKDGRFRLTRFVFFALFRPWYWRPLIRMGENSRKASRAIAESLLDLLDEQGQIRKRNGYPKHTR